MTCPSAQRKQASLNAWNTATFISVPLSVPQTRAAGARLRDEVTCLTADIAPFTHLFIHSYLAEMDLEEQGAEPRTKQTARKSTGAKAPRKSLAARSRPTVAPAPLKRTADAALGDAAIGGLADPLNGVLKKKKVAQKGAKAPQVDGGMRFEVAAGPSQQTWPSFGSAEPSQSIFMFILKLMLSLLIQTDSGGNGAPSLYPGLISLRQLCDLAQTTHDATQSHLQLLGRRIHELQAEYEASRTEAVELRSEVEKLRQTNEQLYSENVALRQQAWGAGRT